MTIKRPVDKILPHAGRVEAIDAKRCVNPPFGCGKPIGPFRDALSEKEAQISGLCQDCQDKVFGGGAS
jgi:hypothetical protein